MLSQSDIEFIKANRTELMQNRTVTISLVREVTTALDEYTGEISGYDDDEPTSVIWKEVSTIANGERDVVNGVELQTGDVQVTFDSTVVLSDVKHVVKDGVAYVIVTVDEKGIGAVNRLECIVRRAT